MERIIIPIRKNEKVDISNRKGIEQMHFNTCLFPSRGIPPNMVWDPKAPLDIPIPAQHVLGGRQERLGNIARRPRIQSTNTHTHTHTPKQLSNSLMWVQEGKWENHRTNT